MSPGISRDSYFRCRVFPVLLDSMIVCYCGEDSDDFGDYEDSGDGNGEDGDIYLIMQCLSVCHEK